MLLNLSNHPSTHWPAEQKKMALQHYGSVVDMAFPDINPAARHEDIAALAGEYAKRCKEVIENDIDQISASAVHIMGEHTFCFALVALLQRAGVKCIASTTRRVSHQNGAGEKTSLFSFVRFRPYPVIDQP